MHKPDNFNRALCSAVYTVAPGDTLYQIARKYGTDYQRLMMLNGIKNPYNIQPGQKICIPRNINYGDSERPHKPHRPESPHRPPRSQHPVPETSQETQQEQIIETEPAIQQTQTVETETHHEHYEANESPENTFNSAVSDESASENASDNTPSANDRTFITAYISDSSADGIIYHITPGESLTSIQAKFGVCLDALKKENPDIDFSDDITGLTICIPYEDRFRKTCSRSFYAVKHGDSINTVAEKTGISPDGLLLLNPAYSPEDFSITGNLIRLI